MQSATKVMSALVMNKMTALLKLQGCGKFQEPDKDFRDSKIPLDGIK